MATSSITKNFVAHDNANFERLKKEVEKEVKYTSVPKSPSLKKGREKLATFVFR